MQKNNPSSEVYETDEQHSPLSEIIQGQDVIHKDQILQIQSCIHEKDCDQLVELIEGLHNADLADVLETLPIKDCLDFISLLGDQFDSEILSFLEDDVRDELIKNLDMRSLATAVENLDSDNAVDIVEELEDVEKEELFQFLPARERDVIQEALSYPEDTAGRMVHKEVVVLPFFWSVGETIDYLREEAELPEQFYEIYVVDAKFRPVGVLHLSQILRNKRSSSISELMSTQYHPIQASTDQEHAADMFRQYGLVSAPVINEEGILLGEITVDDIFPVIDEEAQEDMLKLAGVQEQQIYNAAFEITRSRFSWLFVNLLTAILASVVIGFFEATIEKLVALAILMPIVASMGGNAGTQTLAVAVRAIATKRINKRNVFRVAKKEVLAGFFNGVLFSIIMAVIAYLWFTDPLISFVIASAMITNLIIAGLSGFSIPFLLHKMKVDPAVASPVILTTITDVVGFFSFLGLASLIMT